MDDNLQLDTETALEYMRDIYMLADPYVDLIMVDNDVLMVDKDYWTNPHFIHLVQ